MLKKPVDPLCLASSNRLNKARGALSEADVETPYCERCAFAPSGSRTSRCGCAQFHQGVRKGHGQAPSLKSITPGQQVVKMRP